MEFRNNDKLLLYTLYIFNLQPKIIKHTIKLLLFYCIHYRKHQK